MPKKQLFDFACEYRHQTLHSVLVYDGKKEVWVPKSIAEFDPPLDREGAFISGPMTCTVPEWFAKKEGLC